MTNVCMVKSSVSISSTQRCCKRSDTDLLRFLHSLCHERSVMQALPLQELDLVPGHEHRSLILRRYSGEVGIELEKVRDIPSWGEN